MALNSTIFLAETELRADESSFSVTERIVRTGSPADEVRITYGVTGNTAAHGQDFVGGVGTVTMPAGAAEVSVQIRLLDDAAAEGTEVLAFSLLDAEGGVTLWAPRTSRISILDDEAPSPPPPAEPPLASDFNVREVPFVNGLNQPTKFAFSPVDPSRIYVAESPFAKSWGGQSPAIGMNEAVKHQADRGQGDHRLGDLRQRLVILG